MTIDLGELPEIGPEKRAEIMEENRLAGVRKQGRDAAVLLGRLLGEQTARERGDTGRDREQRIARAMAYAAWEYDGKPESSAEQRREFGVKETVVAGASGVGSDFKKGR
jgi:hypothetical protein